MQSVALTPSGWKRGGLLDLPFPQAERAGELTHVQRTGLHADNAQDAVETFAAEDEGAHGERWGSSV